MTQIKDTKKDPHPERAQHDEEERLDEDIEQTFPASDAPALGGVTKITGSGEEVGSPRDEEAGKDR